jgi:hypothetical protein
VVSAYCACRRPANEWAEIKNILSKSGDDIFLVLDMSYWMFKVLKEDVVDTYSKVADMIYIFEDYGSTAYSIVPNTKRLSHEQLFGILNKVARLNSITAAKTITPGYCGGWLANQHNSYNPHRCFDLMLESFSAYDKQYCNWVHLTTWNDLVETAVHPLMWDFATQIDLLRWFKNEIMLEKQSPKKRQPRLYFGYFREILAGSTLRIEALCLPRKNAKEIERTGLRCKTGEYRFFPKRIYAYSSCKKLEEIPDIYEKISTVVNPIDAKKYGIYVYRIDLSKSDIGKCINFYTDDMMDDKDAVYTYSNIPPECIKLVDIITV